MVEVVACQSLKGPPPPLPRGGPPLSFGASLEGLLEAEDREVTEDDDVLEIPLFVRLEYEQAVTEGGSTGLAVGNVATTTAAGATTSATSADGISAAGGGEGEGGRDGDIGKRTRELAYWAVLGVGRVANPSAKMPEQK